MEKGWLRSRLTAEKQKSPLWTGLADAIQTLVECVVEPLLKRNDDRKSFYTMAEEDLDLRISELGQFFNIRTSSQASKPLLLAQRLDEIHLKNTDQPIINTFWREFNNMTVEWMPIWAPVDQVRYPYGSLFLTEDSVDTSSSTPVDPIYGELFLTSRGTISVQLEEVYRAYCEDGAVDLSMAVAELLKDFELYIHPLVPQHIVFDGVTITLEITLVEDAEAIWLDYIESHLRDPVVLREREEYLSLRTTTEIGDIPVTPCDPTHKDTAFRFDDIPADDWITDIWRAPDFFAAGVYFMAEPGAVHFEYTPENDGQEHQYAVEETLEESLKVESHIEHFFDVSGTSDIESGDFSPRLDTFPADEILTDLGSE